MTRTFTSTLQRLDSEVWGLFFDIPKEVSNAFLEAGIKRFVYTFDNGKKIHRAMMPHGGGRYFLYVNKALMKELGYAIGSSAQIEMKEDKSKYGMPMPEELEEALLVYPDAKDYFNALTPGRQRNLIYMVSKPKRVETRVKKAIQIAEYLEHASGKLDFKELNAWFKDHNNI